MAGVRHLPRILAPIGPQVHDGENEIRGEHDDVPHDRRAKVGVHEQLPQAQGTAQVNHHKADGHAGAQMLVQMATREMSPKPFMPKALGMELMIRPPADRPTKNMNRVM